MMNFVLIGLFYRKKLNKGGFAFKYGEKVVERLAWFVLIQLIFNFESNF
jgi:hypothetical protein